MVIIYLSILLGTPALIWFLLFKFFGLTAKKNTPYPCAKK